MRSIHLKLIALVLVFFAVGFFSSYIKTTASTSDNMHGSAWSDNIGWISFNCTDGGSGAADMCSTSNYGVTKNKTTGELSGYAWSDNIGWISLNANNLTGCPSGTCKAVISGGKLTGWARACAVFASGCSGTLKVNPTYGTWDGWINFYNVSVASTPDTKGDYALSGYAWGHKVVGWVDMSGVYYNEPTTPPCDPATDPNCQPPVTEDPCSDLSSDPCVNGTASVNITATPAIVSEDGSTQVKLAWTTAGVTSCNGAAYVNGVIDDTLTEAWNDQNGKLDASGGDKTISGITKETRFEIRCGTRAVKKSVLVDVVGLSYFGGPSCVVASTKPTLQWTSENTTQCTASSVPNDTLWNGGKSISGSQEVSAINQQTSFSLQCKNTAVSPAAVTKTVNKTISLCVPNFVLRSNPSQGNMIKTDTGSKIENRIKIFISPINGFNSDVTLSASGLVDGEQPTFNFYSTATGTNTKDMLSSSEYNSGVYLEVIMSKLPAKGSYTITVTATDEDGNVADKTLIINLNSDKKRLIPFYREF